MAYFLHGEWNAFNIYKGKLSIFNYKVFITHNTPDIIGVQEEASYRTKYKWCNMGISKNIGNIGQCFDIDWEDRCDSKGNGANNSHNYRVKIVSNNLMLQIVTSNNETQFSFGNWVRTNMDETQLNQELISAAKNGDTVVYNWLKKGGFDMTKINS